MGIVAGGSVFGTQFYGSEDMEGFKESFRFRLFACVALSVIAFFILFVFGEKFISLFLHAQGDVTDANTILLYGNQYLTILLIGMIPYALTQVYASAMKDMGKTLIPMIASIIAILSNTILNYILIFGMLS